MCGGRSISSLVIRFLTLVGIIPAVTSKYLEMIRFFCWMSIVLIIAGAWLSVTGHQIEIRLRDLTIDSLMIMGATLLVYPLNTVGTILALSKVSSRYPSLIICKSIPLPGCTILLGIVLASFIWVLSQNIPSSAPPHLFPGTLEKVIAILQWGLSTICTLTSTLTIAISVTDFKTKIDKLTTDSAITDLICAGVKNVETFRALKLCLSPVMFIHFTVNCSIFVGYSYLMLSLKQWSMVIEFYPIFFFALMCMVYVCVVVDNCFCYYKSTTDVLRYYCRNATNDSSLNIENLYN